MLELDPSGEPTKMLRIIDYKKIDLTDTEFQLYQEICRAYDSPKFKGEDLFKELFETDSEGQILFLRPPNKTFTSMEVYLFLVNITIHQQLRQAQKRVDNFIVAERLVLEKELKYSRDRMTELEERLMKLEKKEE